MNSINCSLLKIFTLKVLSNVCITDCGWVTSVGENKAFFPNFAAKSCPFEEGKSAITTREPSLCNLETVAEPNLKNNLN